MKILEFIEKNEEFKIAKFVYNFGSYIYFICNDDGTIIYIGTTANLQTRMKSHLANIDFAGKDIYYFEYPLADCIRLEKELISKIKPIKNNTGKYGGIRQYDVLRKTNLLKTKQIKKDLRIWLRNQKISQSEIARKMGVSRQRIQQIFIATNLHDSTIKRIEQLIHQLKKGKQALL